MKLRHTLNEAGQLRLAVRNALALSVASSGLFSFGVSAQETAVAKETTELETIEVTGSLLKQADLETASPIAVIDRAAIEASGVVTLGQLLQELPNIAGAATNPQVNNGGGDGSATVSLRGLGSARTLLLLNGRRLVSVDVNAIPINMIERVDVLKDGASSTYGSDAIGGVVNFITRKSFQGSELAMTVGNSARDDGALTGVYGTFGTASGTTNTILGLNFDKRDAVSSADREFSKAPFALYYGAQIVLGSSRNPQGVYGVPRTVAASAGINCAGTGANVTLTRRAGAVGDDMSDFRCYDGAGPANDSYNFQTVNVVMTPQERYGAFLQHSAQLTDVVDFFAEAFYHNTLSAFQIAAEPLDASSRGLVASSESIYNPFGVNVSDLRLRLIAVGNRTEQYDTDRFQTTLGLTGDVFERFNWEGRVTYGRETIETEAFGELYAPGVQSAIGPSFINADGEPTCGTAAAPIANCVPVNFFGVPDPAALGTLTPRVHDRYYTDLMLYHAKIRGDLVQLPAGALAGALGFEYREEAALYQPDYLREQSLISGNGSSGVKGEFDVAEVFAELAVPLLADVPGVTSLGATLGFRQSDYSTFGSTSNFKLGIEYRPVREALVRATFAEVFRSPTISNLFGGQNDSADTYLDPCNGLTAIPAPGTNAALACQNVPVGFLQPDSQLNARVGGNPDVQPEEGESFTLGLVYTPAFYEAMTLVVDFWHFELTDTIGTAGTQNRLTQCFELGLFCDSFTRSDGTDGNDPGEVVELIDVVGNVGALETDGVDIGLQFRFADTPYGRFNFFVDSTYLMSYDNEQLAGVPSTLVKNVGRFNEASAGGDGHFARVRANTRLVWKMGDFSAQWGSRYIHGVTESAPDFGLGLVDRDIDAFWYHDLVGSYNLAGWNTEITLGIDNVTDEVAPLIYSGFNGTTDVRTYDALGTFYYTRVKFSF